MTVKKKAKKATVKRTTKKTAVKKRKLGKELEEGMIALKQHREGKLSLRKRTLKKDDAPRFAHFWSDDHKLLATVATMETPPILRNKYPDLKPLIVGISRCNLDADEPNRMEGKGRATARVINYCRYLGGQDMTGKKKRAVLNAVKRRLILTMTVEEFKSQILHANPFKLGRGCPFGGESTYDKK